MFGWLAWMDEWVRLPYHIYLCRIWGCCSSAMFMDDVVCPFYIINIIIIFVVVVLAVFAVALLNAVVVFFFLQQTGGQCGMIQSAVVRKPHTIFLALQSYMPPGRITATWSGPGHCLHSFLKQFVVKWLTFVVKKCFHTNNILIQDFSEIPPSFFAPLYCWKAVRLAG